MLAWPSARLSWDRECRRAFCMMQLGPPVPVVVEVSPTPCPLWMRSAMQGLLAIPSPMPNSMRQLSLQYGHMIRPSQEWPLMRARARLARVEQPHFPAQFPPPRPPLVPCSGQVCASRNRVSIAQPTSCLLDMSNWLCLQYIPLNMGPTVPWDQHLADTLAPLLAQVFAKRPWATPWLHPSDPCPTNVARRLLARTRGLG